MTLYRNKYRIESARLQTHDYTGDGRYFITICTRNRLRLFGDIVDGDMVLNRAGVIVSECWFDLPSHYPNLILDAFVVMPNHVHAIMIIDNKNAPPGTRHGVSEFVRALKSFSSRRVNEINGTPGATLWQTRFYDRIIRDDTEFARVRAYIVNNPKNWVDDEMNDDIFPGAHSVSDIVAAPFVETGLRPVSTPHDNANTRVIVNTNDTADTNNNAVTNPQFPDNTGDFRITGMIIANDDYGLHVETDFMEQGLAPSSTTVPGGFDGTGHGSSVLVPSSPLVPNVSRGTGHGPAGLVSSTPLVPAGSVDTGHGSSGLVTSTTIVETGLRPVSTNDNANTNDEKPHNAPKIKMAGPQR